MEVLSSRTIHVTVADTTMVAEARRRVAMLADTLGFGETEGGRVAIVATELATNLLKHAAGGDLYICAHTAPSGSAIDIIAIDRGRGMRDVNECLRDGFSTAGSPGTGLGAVSRLSTRLDIHSVADKGTTVHARVIASPEQRGDVRARADIFGLCLPHPYEEVAGDAWFASADDAGYTLAVIDGLGHGPLAADASKAALVAVERLRLSSPTDILEAIHLALRGTRGAVGGVARIDTLNEKVTYCGIGNIAAMIVSSGETKRLMSLNGTLGSSVRRFQSLDYPFPPYSVFVLSSDGLASQVDVAKYPGLAQQGAPVIAGRLMADYRRGRDDATVVVFKEARST